MKPFPANHNSSGCWFGVLLAIGVFVATAGLAQLNWVGAGTKVSKATAVHYASGETNPLMTVRSDRVYGDYQTRGFFRIGVLPLVMVDGLDLELHDPSRIFTAITNAPYLLGKQVNPKGALQIRRFSLRLAGQDRALLTARTVRVMSGTTWSLGPGVLRQSNGAELFFQRAILTVAGPQAGEIVCETAAGVICEHVRFTSSSQSNPKGNP